MKPPATPFLISLALLASCGGSSEPRIKTVSSVPTVAVQTTEVACRQVPDVYEATGTVRARTAAVLSSKVMAYVEHVAVQAGDRVRPGQILVTLDERDLETNVRRAETAQAEVRAGFPEADGASAAAKANLDLAQATFRRMQELAAKKSISTQEFDEASARLKSAQAGYDMAKSRRAQLDAKVAQMDQEIKAASIVRQYSKISAPFAGVVTAKSMEPGTLAAPGTPLLTLEREDSYRLEALVDESRLPGVKVGQTVEVSLEALDRRLSLRVSEIVPVVDAASRTYTVKIDLPALAGVRSGMFGRASFALGSRQVVTIPAAALQERGQLQSVFVIEDATARTRLITTGRRFDSNLEVLSGLSESERVIAPIAAGLTDGARVEVRP